ncbi:MULTISPECIES: GNAT family N-acetyltransferase [Streptomyces]|jgi:ribosomal protein S18 acetylase RimI-like enzyme|uniref:GNAT family N-acetyltransferase n=1 Tax=Streptomyces thermoviolaceus subsp. thermoviolaceus TaxID=66860 RepID=A0ABX0YLJ3_STRTL|nr:MULTISPECIES: GNAT family N-acetyltransferase [Streptomyces]WTD49970.1 GNAT family N-acetyltransferase [Streptomyces thermoviolaceus]NJP12862.1 GNAT family N-acetyltransferase [Streptomyces thermoviolaceus subsp. thermoviolaceus]RSR99477.1 GNAT family N-acetyltransferase [Streptomyces sp. WAC00469]GGV68015.1 N-acetyltransferase [Streptomyces thermoviolaceus subsp. apingens]GHA81460.1 N-acetyltransferase [Streptomyces thermoviolaceus subsp. thermoviolaceus]
MGMSVTISAATEQDAEQILKLQYLSFQSEAALYGNYRIDPLVQSLDSVREEVAHDCVIVARLGEEVVGSVRGRVGEDGAAVIGKLCVHPRLQGHGIGARLLRAVESALAEKHGATRFRLQTGHRSENNLRLYRRVGYETVGTDRGTDGVPMIVLEKPAGSYAATA